MHRIFVIGAGLALGLGCALVAAAGAGALLVPPHPWAAGAFTAGPAVVLVLVVAVVVGVAATMIAWRALLGPRIEHVEWTLVFPSAATAPAARTAGEIVSALAAAGYQAESRAANDLGVAVREAGAHEALDGSTLELREAGAPLRLGRVVLRVPPRAAGQPALGFVDAWGALDGGYEEMALFCIAALGALYPGLDYKRLDSGLSEEPAAGLRDQLPATAERLTALRRAARAPVAKPSLQG